VTLRRNLKDFAIQPGEDISQFGEQVVLFDAPLPEPIKVKGRLTVVSFDPSLASTGWAMLVTNTDGQIFVQKTGNPKSSLKGTDMPTNFMKSRALAAALTPLVQIWVGDCIFLMETPPSGGGRGMKMTESPLMAATTISTVLARHGVEAELINTRQMKKHVVGNGNAKKPDVGAAVKARYPALDRGTGPINVDTLDAIAVGITYLEKNHAAS
jgi:hypothetical protein